MNNIFDRLPELTENSTKSYAKIEGETEDDFVARNEAEYAKKAINVPPALLLRASSFIRAIASKLFQKETTALEQLARLNICYECPEFLVDMKRPELQGYCRACGCGKTPLSSLANKSKIQSDTCPKNKWPILVSQESSQSSSSAQPEAES